MTVHNCGYIPHNRHAAAQLQLALHGAPAAHKMVQAPRLKLLTSNMCENLFERHSECFRISSRERGTVMVAEDMESPSSSVHRVARRKRLSLSYRAALRTDSAVWS